MRVWRSALGILLGAVARLWLSTLRVEVRVDPRLAAAAGRPWVLSFFHGTQWPLLAWRRRRQTVVLVSHSADGTMQARALAAQGLSVVRGSSSRGGTRGLAALVRAMKASELDAAFAVDGPRGPYGSIKGGALVAARATGGVLVPMGGSTSRGMRLEKSWDRFQLAWPFSRVTVTLGEPIEPDHPHALEALHAGILRANSDAA